MKSKRIGIINDLHIPFQSPANVSAVLTAFDDAFLDEIIINGDLLDFYNLNMHEKNKHPDVISSLEDEIYAGIEFLEDLRNRFPRAKILFIFGNHEDRLNRYIVNKIPSFHNILRLESQLRLKQFNISHIDYNQKHHILPDLYVQHSPPSYAKSGAMTSLEHKLDCSAIYGCTHRVQHACRTGSSGKIYNVYFNGWLGSTTLTKEHERVFSYAKKHENWQGAAMIVDVIGDYYSANQFLVHEGRCTVDGYVYEG